MSQPSLFDAPRVRTLNDILHSIRTGELQFPDFQRPFVWKPEQRLQLFDSVLKGMPIGSVLIWRSKERMEIKAEVGGVKLPSTGVVSDDQLHNYVLDGLQRLTTLYAALIGGVGGYEHGDDEPAEIEKVYIDVAGDLDEGDHTRFKLGKQPQGATWMPLDLLFDDDRLWDFQAKLSEAGLRAERNRARHMARRFARFEIPMIPIVTSDLELVTRTFERVNTQGAQMNEAHMLRALLYSSALGLDERFGAIDAASAWPEIPHQILVNTIKAMLGQSVYRSDMRAIAKAIQKNDADGEALFQRLHGGMVAAIDFLRADCGVYSVESLPYAYQLVALALAMIKVPEPDTSALARWFWLTTYGEYFTGQNDAELRRSFDDALRIARGESPTLLTVVDGGDFNDLSVGERPRDVAWPPDPIESIRAGTVRSLAWFHRLAERDLIAADGSPVDGKALLGRGSEVAVELFPRVSKSRPGNRLLAAPETLKELRTALFDPSHPHVHALREGHGLPPLDDPRAATQEAILAARSQTLHDWEAKRIEALTRA